MTAGCGMILATCAAAVAGQPDRALVVLRTGAAQAFASWRLLGADDPGTAFAVELA